MSESPSSPFSPSSSTSPFKIVPDPAQMSILEQIESLPLSALKEILLEASLNSPVLEAKIRESAIVQYKIVKAALVMTDPEEELEKRLGIESENGTVEEILAILKQFQEDVIIQFETQLGIQGCGRIAMKAFSEASLMSKSIEDERDIEIDRRPLLQCLESFVAMSWGKWESEKFSVARLNFEELGFTETEWQSVWYQYIFQGYEPISSSQIISPPCPYPHPYTLESHNLLLSFPPEIFSRIFTLASEQPYIPILVDAYVNHEYFLERTKLLTSIALTHSTWRILAQLELISSPEVSSVGQLNRFLKFVASRRLSNKIHRIIFRSKHFDSPSELVASFNRLAILAPNLKHIELSGSFCAAVVATFNLCRHLFHPPSRHSLFFFFLLISSNPISNLVTKASFFFRNFAIADPGYRFNSKPDLTIKLDLPLVQSLSFCSRFRNSLLSTASITRLVLGNPGDIEELNNLKQIFPNVWSLELTSTYDDDNQEEYDLDLFQIADYLPNLTSVTLNLVQTLSSYQYSIYKVLEDLISKNKLLETIEIEFFPHIDPTSRRAQHPELHSIVEMQNEFRSELQSFVNGTAIGKIKLVW